MNTLQEIKDEVAKDNGFVSWDNLTFIHAGFIKVVQPFNDEVSKRFAIEVSKEALNNASGVVDYYVSKDNQFYHEAKESILDESNIPQL